MADYRDMEDPKIKARKMRVKALKENLNELQPELVISALPAGKAFGAYVRLVSGDRRGCTDSELEVLEGVVQEVLASIEGRSNRPIRKN